MSQKVNVVPDENGNNPKVDIGQVVGVAQVNLAYVTIKAPAPLVFASGINLAAANATAWATGNTGDWSGWSQQVWKVDNTHNQPVDIVLYIMNGAKLSKFDGTDMKITIPLSKSNLIITPADFPILGYTLTDQIAIQLVMGATAPAAGGGLTITSYPRPLV